MPSFSAVTTDEAASLAAAKASKTAVDLTDYREMVKRLVANPDPTDAKFSVWAKMTLGDKETPRVERRRMLVAAKEVDKFLACSLNPNEKRNVYLRLRPAPVARAKRNGKVNSKAK